MDVVHSFRRVLGFVLVADTKHKSSSTTLHCGTLTAKGCFVNHFVSGTCSVLRIWLVD